MISIVDYNAGNLRSVKRACDAVGVESAMTQDPDVVRHSSRVIFPGVGAAASAMNTLESSGLGQAIRDVHRKGIPILGICLGAQIILERSEEDDTRALGLLPGQTLRFQRSEPLMKIPHIGWNTIEVVQPHPLLEGLQGRDVYFVHSYYPSPSNPADVYATTDHFGEFCCALGRGNLFATQFHPEKSGRVGLELLRRFSTWSP